MLQARQLGKELYVGVHSDEEILLNKGPVVMKLEERMAAVEACKWTTQAVSDAPYVTDPEFMAKYGCKYVVHGDDITTDANGEDCYKGVKDLGMFVVVKRTPNISTTDLVGRMLLMSKSHHFKPIESYKSSSEHPLFSDPETLKRFADYASDSTGSKHGSGVYLNLNADSALEAIVQPSSEVSSKLYSGIHYIDGGFDLFHPGHIEVLRLVRKEAEKTNSSVVIGLHDDKCINTYKGLNYPIMNLFERSLCVLQCRYVDAVVIGAPYSPTEKFLAKLPGPVSAVYHGPTELESGIYDGVSAVYKEIGPHKFDEMNTEFIVNRVLDNKQAYEERQKRKGWKAENEKQLKLKEEESKSV
ncbi:cytidyltransferase-like domain protein [Clavispora lusitaniae]|uniref:ethanolamine-phosphate cytidylyltransferase n=1 Tax=Clavispora lusitaniae (strain ATCC 42720) TaxID=306902 RepID=C4XZE3_CLAL4|nr:uncharacterized protein CLUG_01325 [Clavispora lusitaniae ATCC 42720]EEQ37202.1 hypothetical protein CLUG_01325 [Clavispora lusitaniae ATCC 42720]KAF5212397.1 hypothetical protein E0198_001961 [Clavispora lusitaniae]KAF7583816.1 cytidyltransferase-like domain protein [Clavispora lusitaniae]